MERHPRGIVGPCGGGARWVPYSLECNGGEGKFAASNGFWCRNLLLCPKRLVALNGPALTNGSTLLSRECIYKSIASACDRHMERSLGFASYSPSPQSLPLVKLSRPGEHGERHWREISAGNHCHLYECYPHIFYCNFII
jgi:hypothetical protein